MATDSNSILITLRTALGLNSTDDSFDADLKIYANGAFSALHQQGFGKPDFYLKNPEQTWDETMSSEQFTSPIRGMVESYVMIQSRMLFDPPPPSIVAFMTGHLEQLQWRIQVECDSLKNKEGGENSG